MTQFKRDPNWRIRPLFGTFYIWILSLSYHLNSESLGSKFCIVITSVRKETSFSDEQHATKRSGENSISYAEMNTTRIDIE